MAIYKRGREFELGTTEHKSSKWPERDSNAGPPDCESDALTTRPRCPPACSQTLLSGDVNIIFFRIPGVPCALIKVLVLKGGGPLFKAGHVLNFHHI